MKAETAYDVFKALSAKERARYAKLVESENIKVKRANRTPSRLAIREDLIKRFGLINRNT